MTQVLLTRPEAASQALAAAIRAQAGGGFGCVISPLIGIKVIGALPDMGRYRGVIFTSAHGVRAYTALSGPVGGPCFVVGAATAEAAREAGFDPMSAEGDAGTLVEMITVQNPDTPLVHLRGMHSRGDVAKSLNSAGIETHEAVLYDQPELDLTPQARAILTQSETVIVPLYSPRTAARLAQVVPDLRAVWVAAMSQAVADALGKTVPGRLLIAARPTGTAMQNLVAMLIEEATTLETRKSAQ